MRYLVTGVHGQLGYDIVRELQKRGEYDIVAPTKEELDIKNKEQVQNYMLNTMPDIVFHCAAYTKVDNAEEDQSNCYQVNVEGTKNLVEASHVLGSKVIYLSTDYVFDGRKSSPYQENDKVNPQNVYGMSKYLGEEIVRTNPNHFIARISWVFGINGNNFVKTMLRLSQTHQELNIVNDQIGSPTYTKDLAKLLVDMSETDHYGTYHVTNENYCSWAEFAEYIFSSSKKKMKVNPVTTEEYVALTGLKQAYRPRNSRLSKQKLEDTFYLLPSWQDATSRYIEELEGEKRKIKK